jgi:nucleotide-binding universal stress UspA family protein
MYRKVLLCYDGTLEGRRALREGGQVVVAMQSAAYLLAICRNMVATSVPEGITPELVACQADTAKALLAEGVQWLTDRGVAAQGSLVYGDPLVHIPKTAVQVGADLIVVGHRYRSRIARWWSESEQQTLLNNVSCSLLIAMNPPE